MSAVTMLMKPAAAGAIATGASKYIMGTTGSVSTPFGVRVPGSIALGVVTFAATVIADLAKEWVIPYVPLLPDSIEKIADKAVGPGLTGTGAALMDMYLISGQESQPLKTAVVAAGSNIAADYMLSALGYE